MPEFFILTIWSIWSSMVTVSLGKARKCSLWNARKIQSHSSNGMSVIANWTIVVVVAGLAWGPFTWWRYMAPKST